MSWRKGAPRRDASPDTATRATSREAFYKGAAAGLTALIVDDDPHDLFALTVLLERGGMTVLTATNGVDALETLAQRADIRIVLMDTMMPVMDGYQTIAAIRKRPWYRHLPILAVTAKDTDGERERCMAAGASDCVPKPVNATELLGVISHWLLAQQ